MARASLTVNRPIRRYAPSEAGKTGSTSLLNVSRSTLNFKPVDQSNEQSILMRIIDEIYMKDPCIGSRRLGTILGRDHGIQASRKRIQRLRRQMEIEILQKNKKGFASFIFG